MPSIAINAPMTMTFRSRLLACLTTFVLVASQPLSASDFSIRWTFDDPSDNSFDPEAYTSIGPVEGSPVTSNATFGSNQTYQISYHSAVINPYDPGDYFQFSLSLSVDNDYIVDDFSFLAGSFLNGATDWELRSSLDAYASILATGTTHNSITRSANNLGLYVDGGEAFTFRIYGIGGSADRYNGFLVDHVTVSGHAIPEPASAAVLLGLTALSGAALRRRRSAA